MPDLTTVLGLIALIFLVAALASGLVEREPISFPMIYLALGFSEFCLMRSLTGPMVSPKSAKL